MNRCALVALLLTACDGAFDLEHIPNRDVDAATSDGSPDAAAEVCLEDHFETTPIDAQIWATYGAGGGVTVRISNGHAEIVVPAATASAQHPYGGFTTAPRPYVGTAAQVEVIQAPPGGEASELTMQFTSDSSNFYRISVQSFQLTYGKTVNGTPNEASVSYSTTAHRFFQMRHDVTAGEIVFEARSATGAFVELGRTAADLPLTAAYFELYAGSFNVAPSFTASVDNALVLGDCTP
jgi:hypothetical protein